MSGGFGTYARQVLARGVTCPQEPAPTPRTPLLIFDVVVDYGGGRRIQTTTYAATVEEAAAQMWVVEVIGRAAIGGGV